MTALHPQFVTDPDGKRLSVLLPIEEYEALLEALEDAEDLRDARAVQDEPSLPWASVRAEIGAE